MLLTGYSDAYEQYEDYKRVIMIYLSEYITFCEKQSPPDSHSGYSSFVLSAAQAAKQQRGSRFTLSGEGSRRVKDELLEIEEKAAQTEALLPFEYLSQQLGLSDEDKLVVMAGFMASFDTDVSRLYEHISGGRSTAISLAAAGRIFLSDNILKMYTILKSYIPIFFDIDTASCDFSQIELKTARRTFDFLLGAEFKSRLDYLKTYCTGELCEEMYGRDEEKSYMLSCLLGGERLFALVGEKSSGRTFFARSAAAAIHSNIVVFDAAAAAAVDRQSAYVELMRAVRFQAAYVAIKANESDIFFTEEQIGELCEASGCVVIICEQQPRFTSLTPVKIAIGDISHEAKVQMLKSAGVEEDSAEKLLSAYKLYPGRIRSILSLCSKQSQLSGAEGVSLKQLEAACLEEAQGVLSGKAAMIRTKFTLDDLILPDSEIKLIKEGINHIRYRRKVYEEWDFKSKAAYGRGLSMLFEGPPGTGKTMAASIVGNELGLAVFKIDISKMMSKYIGETEKSLGEVFDIARKNNVILFFDETDAIFSKRSEIKDSHDKYANVETAFLLQKLEEYDGIVIMTTNFKQNIDDAFMRRISYVIRFPFPEAEERKRLWKNVFPQSAALECGIDFDFLGESFSMSGAMIKDCAVSAAFLAAAEGRDISMSDILKAVRKQFMKFGKTLSQSEFGIYADMYDND